MTYNQFEEYFNLLLKLNTYNYLYHCLDISHITDEEYDELYKQLENIEKEHYSIPESPTWYVGCPSQYIIDNFTSKNLLNEILSKES